MKTFLVLLLLSCCALAEGEFILMKTNGRFRAEDGIVLTLRAGECFPLVRWDAGHMGATMKVGDETFHQFWYHLRTVVGSREAQARYDGAMARINAEYAEKLELREKARGLEEKQRIARERQETIEEDRRAELAWEMRQQRQMDSIEAALWQIAGQRR